VAFSSLPQADAVAAERAALRSISKDEVNQLPLAYYDGPYVLIQGQEDLARALPEIAGERVLGFDTETRPAFQREQKFPPALLQIAGERQVWLLQLLKLKNLDALQDVMGNASILKTGVALEHDIKCLTEEYGLKVSGAVELSKKAAQLGYQQLGLRALAAMLLGIRISKKEQVSNWAAQTLTERQMRYAAADAWISRELYFRLK
jgi:ribonuclease D